MESLMKKLLFPLLLALSLGACSTQSVLINGQQGRLAKTESQAFFVNGIGQTQVLNAAAVCGGAERVAKVERVESPMNWLLETVSFGVYTPYNAKVYCI
jgi:hypothetical protein